MAEALLRRHLAERGVAATVASTGIVAAGRPATDEAVQAMARRGVDLSAHRSRVLDADQLGRADVFLGLTRRHVREAWGIDPDVLPRAFTLKELVRRGEAVGPLTGDLGAWLARATAERQATDLVGESDLDDVIDPIGQARSVYETVAAQLDELTGRLAGLLGAGAQRCG